MPARLLTRRSDLDSLWGRGTSLPVETIDGDTWTSASTARDRRRTLRGAAEVLRALRALRVSGTVHLTTVRDEPAVEPSMIDAAVGLTVELSAGPVLHLFPHRAGGTAAVFFAATPRRCWVLDLDDLAGSATTLLTMTSEQLGDATWATAHGVSARAVRMVPGDAGTWRLGVITADGFLVAEPDGSVVRSTIGGGAAVAEHDAGRSLARTAGELTRESASLLAAA